MIDGLARRNLLVLSSSQALGFSGLVVTTTVMSLAGRDLADDPSLATLPMAIVRPLTGSGSAGLVAEMIQQYGEDSLFVKMAATMFGSTETTFYVVAVYFGAINIKKTRHAVPAGLTADIAAMLFAVWIVRLLFG